MVLPILVVVPVPELWWRQSPDPVRSAERTILGEFAVNVEPIPNPVPTMSLWRAEYPDLVGVGDLSHLRTSAVSVIEPVAVDDVVLVAAGIGLRTALSGDIDLILPLSGKQALMLPIDAGVNLDHGD
jgi:hypothetical protein